MAGVTKEEIARAKELDLLTYFKLVEPGNLKLVGKEYRHKVHSSLTISKDSLWCWHCIGLRGRTALKYLIDLIMNNPDGMSVAQALAAYTRASTSGAGIQSEDYIDQYYAQDNQKKALELSMKTDMGEHMFPPTSVSEENQDRYSEIMSQVKTLADEMEASFICGTTPMSEWDSYQQKLKDAGIEEAVQMMQEAYDTYMAN